MSEAKINKEFTTKLKDEQFLYVADNSYLGIVLIQRGHLIYYNKKCLANIKSIRRRKIFKHY